MFTYLKVLASGIISRGDIGYDGPTDKDLSIQAILGNVYMIAGMIAVLIIVIAGIAFVTSNGDANRVQKAKMAIMGSVVGLVVILLAFIITQFVIFKIS